MCREGGGENTRIEGIFLNGASLQGKNFKLINNGENNALTDNKEAQDQYQQQGQLIPTMSASHPEQCHLR
jgi:hypothetical protein